MSFVFFFLVAVLFIAPLAGSRSCRIQRSQYWAVWLCEYRNDPKFSDTQKICCNHSKIWTMWLYHRVMSPNDADRMANSVDPDQTALFAQAYLSENLGSLRYLNDPKFSNKRVWPNCADCETLSTLSGLSHYCMIKSHCSNFRIIATLVMSNSLRPLL